MRNLTERDARWCGMSREGWRQVWELFIIPLLFIAGCVFAATWFVLVPR